MPPIPSHRKRVRHYDTVACVHELTFSCYHRLPLLDDSRCSLLAEGLGTALHNHAWRLLAYVFMPEHVHLLVGPNDHAGSVSSLLAAIKRPTSWRVRQVLVATKDPLLERLTVRERPGRDVFRFWQEGGGYDRNLWSRSAVRSSIEYLHANPVRRHLCGSPEHWWWSSWHAFHALTGPVAPRVDGASEWT